MQIAEWALPRLYKWFLLIAAGFGIYLGVILIQTKRNLRGTGRTLWQFMSLPLDERHAVMKSLRRGLYRDA
jgi:hypothetical protein